MITFEKDRKKDIYYVFTKSRIGEICREIGGFYVFYPDLAYRDYWDEYFLTTILNKLNDLNTPLKKELEQWFEKHLKIASAPTTENFD